MSSPDWFGNEALEPRGEEEGPEARERHDESHHQEEFPPDGLELPKARAHVDHADSAPLEDDRLEEDELPYLETVDRTGLHPGEGPVPGLGRAVLREDGAVRRKETRRGDGRLHAQGREVLRREPGVLEREGGGAPVGDEPCEGGDVLDEGLARPEAVEEREGRPGEQEPEEAREKAEEHQLPAYREVSDEREARHAHL